METKNILDVEKFVLECNSMLTGKFFDLNKRLQQFLTVMTQSEDLLDLLADCIDDFDNETEFEKAFFLDRKTGVTKVGLPVEDKKRLALCINLFNDISNEKINSNQFLETYFQDKKLTPMQNFLDKVIKPFRDSVCKMFAINSNLSVEDVKKHIQEIKEKQPEKEEDDIEEFPHIDDLMAAIVKNCNQILSILKFERKRTDNLDDLEFVVGSIVQACEKKDLMVINGLVVGLNYVSKKFRNVKHLVEDLNDLIYDYYEFLQGDVDFEQVVEKSEPDLIFDDDEDDEEDDED